MNNRTINLIVARYFTSRKKIGLISFTSVISILGIGIGSFALVVTMSVLNGFEKEIAERVINIDSHVKVYGKDISESDVRNVRDVLRNKKAFKGLWLYPYVYSKAVISANGMESVVRVKAVGRSALRRVFARRSTIVRGSPDFKCFTSDLPGVILGYRLADKLGLCVGDTLYVMNPFSIRGLYSMPKVRRFVLSGVFELEVFDYDENLIFMDIGEGQKLFERGNNYDGIEIKLSSYKLAQDVKRELEKSKILEAKISTWGEMHRILFGAMKLEKYGSLVVLFLIIVVAVFNLMSSIVMLIVEKIREIGILRTMGATSKAIGRIFVRLGLLNGVIGLFAGVLLSMGLCLAQQYYKFIPLPSVYYIPYLPVVVKGFDIFVIVILGIMLIFTGAFYPSKRIGKMEIVKAINYEK
ncbi:MAG: ABC transporter permease [Candidatus Marinimicrobia bacterium]|nr:ABC transporter permease [Candidatus Neomarinimicrobiota bacterium]